MNDTFRARRLISRSEKETTIPRMKYFKVRHASIARQLRWTHSRFLLFFRVIIIAESTGGYRIN